MRSDLLPLVLVEDGRREEEDGVAEEPQEASLHRTQRRVHDHPQVILFILGGHAYGGGWERRAVFYLGEAQEEVPLQGAPLSGDDLVQDRGQQESQHHPQSHEEEPRQALLGVVAVVLALGRRILLPQQQRSLKKQTTSFSSEVGTAHRFGAGRRDLQAYLRDDATDGDGRGGRRALPLQRPGLRLPAAAQGPAHAQAQQHVQHGHLGHHVPDCTGADRKYRL